MSSSEKGPNDRTQTPRTTSASFSSVISLWARGDSLDAISLEPIS